MFQEGWCISMDANVDRLLRSAIAEKRLVTFVMEEYRRIGEPHDYGINKGLRRLFFYQTGGKSRSKTNTGWRWATLSKISQPEILDDRFTGPRPAPSGRHIQWDVLIATVSPRLVLQKRSHNRKKLSRNRPSRAE
jgi:hypothetical protein